MTDAVEPRSAVFRVVLTMEVFVLVPFHAESRIKDGMVVVEADGVRDCADVEGVVRDALAATDCGRNVLVVAGESRVSAAKELLTP